MLLLPSEKSRGRLDYRHILLKFVLLVQSHLQLLEFLDFITMVRDFLNSCILVKVLPALYPHNLLVLFFSSNSCSRCAQVWLQISSCHHFRGKVKANGCPSWWKLPTTVTAS